MKKIVIIKILILLVLSIDVFGEVKKVDIENIVDGRKFSATFGHMPNKPIEKMQQWIDRQKAKTINCRSWGCSERDVPKFPVKYSPELVISEYQKDGVTWVKLKADYEITITDITSQYETEQADKESRKLEIRQIKQAISLIEASGKPVWEKKLIKRLVLELKE